MPKRKILDSLVPSEPQRDSLAALEKALANPLPPSAHVRSPGRKQHVPEYRTEVRRDHTTEPPRDYTVYREPGKGGADYAVPPFYWHMLKAHRDFEAECAKVERQVLGIRKARDCHQRKSQASADRIREIARTIPAGRGRIKAIARAAGVDVRTVGRALSSTLKR
jgi:hypothetical protein